MRTDINSIPFQCILDFPLVIVCSTCRKKNVVGLANVGIGFARPEAKTIVVHTKRVNLYFKTRYNIHTRYFLIFFTEHINRFKYFFRFFFFPRNGTKKSAQRAAEYYSYRPVFENDSPRSINQNRHSLSYGFYVTPPNKYIMYALLLFFSLRQTQPSFSAPQDR